MVEFGDDGFEHSLQLASDLMQQLSRHFFEHQAVNSLDALMHGFDIFTRLHSEHAVHGMAIFGCVHSDIPMVVRQSSCNSTWVSDVRGLAARPEGSGPGYLSFDSSDFISASMSWGLGKEPLSSAGRESRSFVV
jgi:hypothetical protein